MADRKGSRSSGKNSQSPKSSGLPYERAVIMGFDKLSSEIFIFLLVYVILLIGLAVVAPQLSTTLKTLFYILPILGIVAYLWLKSTGLIKDAEANGIQVYSGIAAGSAQVIGVRGRITQALGRIKVGSFVAIGNARVIARESAASDVNANPDEPYLISLFRDLDDAQRTALIAEANRLKAENLPK